MGRSHESISAKSSSLVQTSFPQPLDEQRHELGRLVGNVLTDPLDGEWWTVLAANSGQKCPRFLDAARLREGGAMQALGSLKARLPAQVLLCKSKGLFKAPRGVVRNCDAAPEKRHLRI